jgi:hypothetical protein
MNDFGPGPATQGDVIQIGPDTSARRLTRCRGIVRLLVTTLFLALVASEGKAGIVASDARPPATRIITPLGSKTGQIYATYWTTRDGPYCATTAGDGPLIFGPQGVAFHPSSFVAPRRVGRPEGLGRPFSELPDTVTSTSACLASGLTRRDVASCRMQRGPSNSPAYGFSPNPLGTDADQWVSPFDRNQPNSEP